MCRIFAMLQAYHSDSHRILTVPLAANVQA
jgi:hypothetical protein